MSLVKFGLLFAVLYSCASLGHGGLTTQAPELLPVDASALPGAVTTSSTTLHPDTTTTEKPTTTTEKPTTTTEKPTTTTEKPTTTTEKTTTSTTTSTTEKPTTTTPAPTTTTVKPTPPPTPAPVPPAEQGTWFYTDVKTNVTCVKVQFAAQFNVTYNKNVNSSIVLSHVLINVPANATVSNGSCAGDQWLTLSWPAANASQPNTLTLVYHSNDTTKNYALKSLNVSLSPDNFDNGTSSGPTVLYHGEAWSTPLATSYRCAAATRLNMTAEAGSAAQLTLSRLQEEAFRTAPGRDFSAARECGGGDVPDAVPIAVGCALGGLVLVVLVAYLVGRRRSAARGYLSM